MHPVFGRLDKVLVSESKAKYADTVVIGGLEKLVAEFARELQTAPPEAQGRMLLVQQMLEGYHELTLPERQSAVKRVREVLGQTEERQTRRAHPERTYPARRQSLEKPPAPPPAMPLPETAAESPEEQQEKELEAEDETEEGEPVPSSPLPSGYGIDAELAKLQGIGPKYGQRLERLGLQTIRDLLYHFPHRYDDYSNLKTISELVYGQEATVIATVLDCKVRPLRNRMHITNLLVGDLSGTLTITFFNQPYLCKSLRHGMKIVISGRVDKMGTRPTFSHPTWEPLAQELLHTARIVPVYPVTEGITNRWLRKQEKGVVDFWAGKLPDPLPAWLRHKLGLADLATALREIHFPSNWEKNEQARRRLAFEEFLIVQIGVLRQRRKWRSEPSIPLQVDGGVLDRFLQSLPFQLTRAQQRALEEILRDISQPVPMSRLLQGDVGSGKTVVAAVSLLMAVTNGGQGVLMAPTEILAEQHYRTISRVFESMDPAPRVGLLIGSLRPKEKEAIHAQLTSGEIQVAIGTHALIQEEVSFQKLALAVIDEQHRFGVAQRAAIRQKGYNPHILVMSATPIPRTLALTVYGDLDLSIIDELPPGRQEIRTKWLVPGEREGAYNFIRKQVAGGRQAFVICPLIEESEVIDAKAAVEEYERLSREVYPDLRVGLVHGKLRPAEKDQVMADFRDARLDLLVATSVVEVGIDVPNATVMLIEGADRFGLAQLHQFRGRVGRGADKSYCLLLAEKKESVSDQRLQIIETTHDGFKLAEEDLKMRGPGEFFGTRQSGLPDLKVAKLSDVKLLESARSIALELFESDPDLALPEHRLLAENVRHFWRGEGDLS